MVSHAGKDPLVMRGYVLAWAHRIVSGNAQAEARVSRGGSAISANTANPADNDGATNETKKILQGVTVGKRKYLLQVIDYVVGKQNHVCRGVWSSELHNQYDMIEMSAIVSGFIVEIIRGPQTGESLRRAIATGDLPMPVEALTDSYSIFSDLAVTHLAACRHVLQRHYS